MPESPVHPSAIGSGTVPKTSSKPSGQPSRDSDSNREAADSPDDDYPKQLHSGKVGYGPAYQLGPTILERVHGLEEQVKGKITHNSETVQRGKERFSGEMKQKQREADMNDADPFANPAEKKEQEQQQKPQDTEPSHVKSEKERAATVAPAGTPAAESQRKSESSSNIKRIG